VLLKSNQGTHDFEPPSQVRALTRAAVVLRNGIGLDAFVNKVVENSDAEVVIVTQGIDLLEGEEHQDEAGGEE
jgi:ABC-type Zn uptake system ZnuABC Zn-binding protein ZnuA